MYGIMRTWWVRVAASEGCRNWAPRYPLPTLRYLGEAGIICPPSSTVAYTCISRYLCYKAWSAGTPLLAVAGQSAFRTCLDLQRMLVHCTEECCASLEGAKPAACSAVAG